MMYELKIDNSEKYIEIIKSNNIYKIPVSLKVGKFNKYLDNVHSNGNYEKAFYELISDSDIDTKMLTNSDKEQIILAIIKYNKLQKYYDNIEASNIYEKLYKTLIDYQTDFSKRLKEVITDTTNSINTVIKKINKNILSKMFEKLNNVLQDSLKNISNTLIKIFDSLPTDKEIERIKKNHEKWGKYGWTIIPNMPINYFYEVPKKQSEADEKCLSFVDKKELKFITNYIYNNIKHRKNFCEARKCFEQGYYLATAMILTSLIERTITELPLKNKSEKKARGKTQLLEKYKESLNIEDESIIELYYLGNISSYLSMFLEDGKDFKRQRFNVNRNFLMHGWRDVKTTKTDCIKLFLALYNVILLWEMRTM